MRARSPAAGATSSSSATPPGFGRCTRTSRPSRFASASEWRRGPAPPPAGGRAAGGPRPPPFRWPTPAPPEVLAATAQPVIHHRGPDYRELYARVLQRLQEVFRTEQEVLLFGG